MYKIIRPGVTDYCWNFDENSGEIFRIAADKKIAINFTKSQRLLLKKLITSELLMVSYDALLAASHGDFGTYEDTVDEKFVNDVPDTVQKAVSKIKKKEPELTELIENISGLGYRFNGIREKIETANKSKTEVELTEEFGKKLKQSSIDILAKWEKQNYLIETELLPSCNVNGKRFNTLYDYIRIEIMQNRLHNHLIYAVGGGGKTSSLVYACKKLANDKMTDNVISAFIRVRNLDCSVPNPISNYLYQHFAYVTNIFGTYNPEKIFMHNLEVFLKESGSKLLIALDGYNEGKEQSLADINIITELPNTMVVVSSRNSEKSLADFSGIQINELENKAVINYLRHAGITFTKNYDPKSLRLPIYLNLYSTIYKNENGCECINNEISSQAEIIDLWVNRQEKIFNSTREKFAVEVFLPLYSLTIYMKRNSTSHKNLNFTVKECLDAVANMQQIFSNESIAAWIMLKYNICSLNKNSCVQLFNEIIVNRYAFFQYDEREAGALSWSHECYRDWFTAKGMYILYLYSKELFEEYFTTFMEERFVYPDVFDINRDYSTFAVAVYFCELIGREALINASDNKFEKFLRNIAFFYEDIGDADNVIKYGDLILDRYRNNLIKVPVIEKSLTLSGLAYSYLHIQNVIDKTVGEELVKRSFEFLKFAERQLHSVVPIEYLTNIDDDRLMSLLPNDLLDLLESESVCNPLIPINAILSNHVDGTKTWNENFELNEGVLSTNELLEIKHNWKDYWKDLDLDDTDLWDIRNNKSKVLPLLSRIYGNLGSYYLNRYFADKSTENLIEAHRAHMTGAVYKYKILKTLTRGTKGYREAEQAFDVSLRSLGIDMFFAGKYELSLMYFYKALNEYESSSNVKAVLRAYIVRSKVNEMLNHNELHQKYKMKDIICEEIKLLSFFEENQMWGEINHMVSIVANTIQLFRENYSECDKVMLVTLIKKIEELHTKYYTTDNDSCNLMNFLEEGGENIWQTYYE